MGLTVFRRVNYPVVFLGALLSSDAMEERYARLLIQRIATIDHMAVHGGRELQLATQLGMIDDMRTIGLQHVLQNTYGFRLVVILLDGVFSELLIAQEAR